MKKLTYFLYLLFFSIQSQGQSVGNWTWYAPDVFDGEVSALTYDPNGNLWMASGTKIIKYDGINWTAYDVLDSGLSENYAWIRSIDASLGDVLWISTFDRVVEFDVVNKQWTLHDPSNGLINLNAFDIKVEAPDRIWWATTSRLWEYNGTSWKSYNFYAGNLKIQSNDPREIEIDQKQQKWITTPAGICIEGGCFTPAGLIRLTDTDTTLFDGPSFGFSDAASTHIDLDSKDNLWLAVSGYHVHNNFYMIYSNGSWSAPINIPFNGSLHDMKLGNDDEMYLTFSDFIAIGKNGVWDVVPLDTSKIEYVTSTLLTTGNDLYVAGRSPGSDEKGILGYLPNLVYRVRGTLYSDRNDNGALDLADLRLQDQFVQTVNQDRISFSNNDGLYSLLFADPGTYSWAGILPPYHSYGLPVNGQYTVTLTPGSPTSDNQDIGFVPDTSAIDLSISITAVNGATPGLKSCYAITVKNLAPRITEGDVSVAFDDRMTFVNSDVPPTSMNGNQFTFHIDGLDWLATQKINICFSLPPDPELMGDTLMHWGSVIPIGGPDLELENNTDSLSIIVTGPCDPNFIEVHPTGKGATGDIATSTRRLEYTIHFQNVGSDTARTIIVTNPIDEDFKMVSLNVIGASHPYNLDFLEDGRILQWTFDQINLPDSTVDRANSFGFVKYTLDLANLDAGSTYTNQADIYFDFNQPVSTNMTLNTLVQETTSLEKIPGHAALGFNLQVTAGKLQLQFPVMDQYEIGIYDMSGRQLLGRLVNNNEFEVGLNSWPKGCYIVSVASRQNRESRIFFIE